MQLIHSYKVTFLMQNIGYTGDQLAFTCQIPFSWFCCIVMERGLCQAETFSCSTDQVWRNLVSLYCHCTLCCCVGEQDRLCCWELLGDIPSHMMEEWVALSCDRIILVFSQQETAGGFQDSIAPRSDVDANLLWSLLQGLDYIGGLLHKAQA